MQNHRYWHQNMRFTFGFFFAVLALSYSSSLRAADLSEAEKSEETARNSLIEHFTRFSGDRNVMAKPQEPDGKSATSKVKTRFDSDDGNPFQSDLTYHDFSYNTTETVKNAKGEEKAERLFAFVSPHGKLSGGSGSSILERTAFQLDQKFEKQDKDEKNQKKQDADAKQGISYRSIFKIETQEVSDDKGKGAGANKGPGGAAGAGASAKNAKADDKGEKIKIERFQLRDEAKPEIEKVGSDSFEQIRKDGRDKGFEEDSKTLPNGVLLRFAAGAATQALWNSTVANLGQRRANQAVRQGDIFPDTPQISEGVPRCENWAETANKVLAKVPKEQKEALSKEIARMSKQCSEATKTSYERINPKFEKDEKGDNESLKDQGVKKEDGFQRDMRVQLEILAKAGKSVKDVQTNWKYKPEDEKAKVTIDYNEGAPKEASLTVKEQIETYNNQLKEAGKGYSEVNSRLPPNLQTSPDVPLKYKIESESRSVMDINYAPVSAMDEAGVSKSMTPEMAKNYDQLINKK